MKKMNHSHHLSTHKQEKRKRERKIFVSRKIIFPPIPHNGLFFFTGSLKSPKFKEDEEHNMRFPQPYKALFHRD
ncbi:hypothetical protein YC2023_084854 [Brassica napus]